MEIIPVFTQDALKPIDNIRTITYFVVDDPLEEKALKDALDNLIRHHWRKLGGRIVARPKDRCLEYHIPSVFDDGYELYRWSSREDGRRLDKAAPSLKAPAPQQTTTLSMLPPVQSFSRMFQPSDWPLERKDEAPDTPLLLVHLTSFSNAAVVAVSVPHVLTDQFGTANIMKAWLGLVEGSAPPPMVGYDEDVMSPAKAYAEYPKQEVVRKGKMRVRRTGEYFFVLVAFVPDLVFRPKEEAYTVFFPLPLLESLRARYSKTLEEKYGAPCHLSLGDVASAILFKLARMREKKSRMVSFSQVINLRNRIPALEGDKALGFVHNALIHPCMRFRSDPSMPASEIAYRNRQSINITLEQGPEIDMAVIREMVRRNQPIHTCEPFERSFSVTNWMAAWKGLDFGAATKKSTGERTGPQRVLVLGRSGETKTPQRFASTIMSRTDEGIWCSFATTPAGMVLVREYLQKDPGLEHL